jgi:hypothetical protein
VRVVRQDPEGNKSKTGSADGEDNEEPFPAGDAIFLDEHVSL